MTSQETPRVPDHVQGDLSERVDRAVTSGKYETAARLIGTVKDRGTRVRMYIEALTLCALWLTDRQFGVVEYLASEAEYDLARAGEIEGIQPETVCYVTQRGSIRGTDHMLNRVPESNALRVGLEAEISSS